MKIKDIIVKIPSRERPAQLEQRLREYIAMSERKASVAYIISSDIGDSGYEGLPSRILGGNISLRIGPRSTKVEAYNRDIPTWNWEILVVSSDDFQCVQRGWDEIIRADFETHFPDGDGVLFYNDGYVGEQLNTMPIMTRKYYDRFKFVYEPSYKSLFCDNEFMATANTLGKQKYIDRVLFKHEHPAWNSAVPVDALYKHNESLHEVDKKNFEERKAKNFDLPIQS